MANLWRVNDVDGIVPGSMTVDEGSVMSSSDDKRYLGTTNQKYVVFSIEDLLSMELPTEGE